MRINNIDSADEMIRRGIIDLQKPQPFFAHLLMNLRPKVFPENANVPVKTMGVNAKGDLYYDEEFVMGQDRKTMEGLLCHEVLHVALLHPARTGKRHQFIANIAQDVVINMMVKKAGLQLPKDAEYDEEGELVEPGGIPVDRYNDSSSFNIGGTQIKIANVSEKHWEEIYSEIIEQLKDDGKSPKKAGSNCNRMQDGLGWDNHLEGGDDGSGDEDKKMSPEEKKAAREKWQRELAEAAQYAKRQGNLPAGMERHIDDILEPKNRWQDILRRYVKSHINPVDWTYRKPHRKSHQLGVYLPTTRKESTEVDIIVDTSGSISQKELQQFFGEMSAILRSQAYVTMKVHFVDADIQKTYELEGDDTQQLLSMKPSGGGGTDMEAGLDHIKEKNPTTPVTVVLTDGYTSFTRSRSDYPFDVIWVITERGIEDLDKIPYGKKIKMGR